MGKLVSLIETLPDDKNFLITIEQKKSTRSLAQNRLLWATYQQILDRGGNTMAGWTKKDLHEFFLGKHFGWDEYRIFGERKKRPQSRSSSLSKMEFSDYIESIVRFMAEQNITLTMPDDLDSWDTW